MATIDFSAVTETTQQSSGATYVVTLPASGTYAVGDLLMIFLYNAGGGTTISQNGGWDWTVVTGQTQTTNIRTAVIYKKAGSTTETNPTFNIANNTVNAVSWVVKNVDATTQVEASSIATAGSATSVTNNTATSVSENALAIFCGGHSSATTVQLRFKSSQATALNANVNLFSNRSTLVGFRQLGASSTTPSTTLYTTTTALNLQLWSIIIKNSSGGALMPWADSGLNELVWYGIHGSPSQTIMNQAPSNFAGGASINSIATSTAAPTMDVNSSALDWGYYTGYNSTENFTSPPASKWVGNYHAYTFPDLTGKVISFEWKSRQSTTATQIGADGHIFALTDGTNFVAYQIAAKATGAWITDQWERITIEPGVTATYATSAGSINLAAVTGALYATHSTASSGSPRECHVKNLVVFDKATVVGGGASYPATWEAAYRALTSCGFYKIARKQAASQYQFDCSVQIGDGSIATYFMPSPQAFEMSPPYNSKTQPWWRVAADKISLTIKAKASDTINLSASSLVTTQSALLSLDAASSTSATYNLQSLLVVGFNVTWSAAEDLTGATFKSGKTVNIAGAGTWTDAIVNSTASANASMSVTVNGHVFDGQTIDGTGAAYALELGTSVTAITLTNCPITAGSTDKVHVLKTLTNVAAGAFVVGVHYRINTVGTTDFTAIGASANTIGVNFTATGAGTGTGTADQAVKITISGSTSLIETDCTTAGAPVWVAAPQPTLSATVLASSRVVLYNNTTDAELDNTAPAGTSWSKVIASGASVNDSLTLHVFKEGYEEFSTSFLYTGDDQVILVTQVTDSNIASLRTELGITDYTTITEFALDTTGTVEIDADDADGNSQKARLAIWYNGVLTTENGARYLRGAISILSTAAFRINVDVLDLQVENISATQGLNFTDTERRLYRSDGTPIYVAASAPGSIQNDYSGVPDTVTTSDQSLNLATAEQAIDNKLASIATGVWSKTLPL